MLYGYSAENVTGRDLTQVEPSTYHSVHVGGPLPIAYLPGDPKRHRIDLPAEIAEEDWVPFDDLVIATAIFVPGVLLIGYFGRRNRIHARLLASRRPRLGRGDRVEQDPHAPRFAQLPDLPVPGARRARNHGAAPRRCRRPSTATGTWAIRSRSGSTRRSPTALPSISAIRSMARWSRIRCPLTQRDDLGLGAGSELNIPMDRGDGRHASTRPRPLTRAARVNLEQQRSHFRSPTFQRLSLRCEWLAGPDEYALLSRL